MVVACDPPPQNPDWLSLSASRRARLTGLAGGLKGVDLDLFIVMAENARPDGHGIRASVHTLADEAGWCVRAARLAIRRLEDGYWARCTYRSRGGMNSAVDKPNMTSTYNVLTLPVDPGPKLTKSKRRAVLFPDHRDRNTRFSVVK